MVDGATTVGWCSRVGVAEQAPGAGCGGEVALDPNGLNLWHCIVPNLGCSVASSAACSHCLRYLCCGETLWRQRGKGSDSDECGTSPAAQQLVWHLHHRGHRGLPRYLHSPVGHRG